MEQIMKDQEVVPAEKVESSEMQSELQIVENKTDISSNNDAELDIASESFNPLKALYATDFRVTEKEPKIVYQNMAAFETALKKVGIVGLNSKPENIQPSGSKAVKIGNTLLVEEEITKRRFQDNQMAIRTQSNIKSKHQRNILTQMAQSEGPLKKLQEFVIEGRTVKVLIRREHGIKGFVEGIIKMFDRHLNLLLVNVTECLEYRKYKYAENKIVTHQEPQDCCFMLQKLGITLPKQHVKSLGRKKVQISKQLPQLLLRGEHVVLISAKIC